MSNLKMLRKFYQLIFLIVIIHRHVNGHGRMEEPPARNAAWRYGFNIPANYDDVGLNCGGLGVQNSNNGKCGICGDAYGGIRDHEAGGKYATNIVVRHYISGALIDVRILLSANHKGFMEFRLCPAENSLIEVTQECLDRHILSIEGYGTQYPVTEAIDLIFIRAQLPANLSCTRCVLQWKYHAGNNWGKDHETGLPCFGCGPQEEFYNCADISITSVETSMIPSTTMPTRSNTFLYFPFDYPVIYPRTIFFSSSSSSMTTTTTTTTSTTTSRLPIINITSVETYPKVLRCYPTNESLKPLVGIENWCLQLCAINCPPSLCVCVYI